MELNQYHTDISGENGTAKLFNKGVYAKHFNINDYQKYQSKDYYKWINSSFMDYSFPSDYSQQTFADLCESRDYSLKPQQKFAARVFNTLVENRGMLIYHGLGSGKTQTSIVIAEAFKFRRTRGDIIPGRTDAVVHIVVPAALVDQYYSEIIGSVENGTIRSASGQVVINGERQFYLNKKVRSAIQENLESIKGLQEKIAQRQGNINPLRDQILELELMNRELYEIEKKRINKVYEIISHEKFLNRLFTIKQGNFIEGESLFSLQRPKGLLIIDEAHGLVSAIGSNYRKLLIALRYYAEDDFRTILLTGSPIYDKPFEFGLLINLLRPRILFPDGFENFNEVFIKDNTMINKSLFRQMCSGYVSYFKGGNPEAYPYKRVILMHHQMSSYQYTVYKNALFKEIERDQKNKLESREEYLVRVATTESVADETATSVFNNSRLFCNIAFPESSPVNYNDLVATGREHFESENPGVELPSRSELYTIGVTLTKRTTTGRSGIIQQGLSEFKRQLRQAAKKVGDTTTDVIKVVKNYSTKFAKIAEIIQESPGPVFIYSNYVFYGVEAMAAVMESLGYSNYPSKGPAGSYFVWKGQADPSEVKRANAAFNNIKNIDGSVLKIMFGTQSVMEGVDFKRVRQIHVLDPWWNDSRMQQVIARGVRLCSHKDLPERDREVKVFIHLSTLGSAERLYKLDITRTDGRVAKIMSTLEPINALLEREKKNFIFLESYVKDDRVYNSKSQFRINQIIAGSVEKMADPELTKRFGRWKQLDRISVEQYMYTRSLTKLNLNRQFEMEIKKSAIDCNINKNGNIIRLEEHFIPEGEMFKIRFLNYSTGQEYLPEHETYYTLNDILSRTLNESTVFRKDDTLVTFPKNLIIPEQIDCRDEPYTFTNIPKKVVDLTLNKEMIKFLKKMPLETIKKFFFDVEHGNVPVADKTLIGKIKKFYSKKSRDEKQVLIDALKEVGIDEDVWDFYSTEELKKIVAKVIKKRIVE
jgi:superfamily II DNA or RNA helicase